MPDLAALFAPRSLVVIGAAPAGQGLRGRILEILRMHPWEGRLHAVSRSHAEVQGIRCYPSVSEVPKPVDLAVLIIPAAFVAEELERCGLAGIKAAVILSSGFAEEAGEAGAAMQARIRSVAGRFDMAVLGPNSEGYANLPASLCPTFSPVVADVAVPLVPEGPSLGRIAVVAQSGGMGFSFYDRGRPRGLTFSHIVTTGNEACLEVADVVEHLVDSDGADVLLLLLEDVKTPATLARAAAKARARGKAIIVTKIGQSEGGTRAAASHTAALAGSYAAFQAFTARHGLIEGRDADEMIDIGHAFLAWRHCLPKGRRVAICTASGGGGGWLADACAADGLEVPVLDDATRATIDQHLPSYGSSQNPIDGTAQAIRQIGYAGLARLALASPEIDAVLVVMSGRASTHLEHERDALAALAAQAEKPVLF